MKREQAKRSRIHTSAKLVKESGKSERGTLPKLKPFAREEIDRFD